MRDSGERVAAKDFSWDRNLPIFTDGSVAFPRWTRLSAGAGAAVQIPDHSTSEENKMVRSVTIQILAGWPQTAVMSEHLALLGAVFGCKQTQLNGPAGVSGWAAVVSGCKNLSRLHI